MEKFVMLSIQPYWVFLIIANQMGWDIPQEKTIEVRKNYPKSGDWNNIALIYCSKDKQSFNRIPDKYKPLMAKFLGKVIGEFICDTIEMVNAKCSDYGIGLFYADCQKYGCLGTWEVNKYFGVKDDIREMKGNGYVWLISELKIYDTPKELSEFRKPCPFLNKDCEECPRADYEFHGDEYSGGYDCIGCDRRITRPFESWGYVEE